MTALIAYLWGWPLVYLAVWATATTPALLTRDRGFLYFSALLLVAWFVENVWRFGLGFDLAPTATVISDICLAWACIRVGQYRRRLPLASTLVVLYGARFVVQIGAVATGGHYGYFFFASLNLLYALQLAALWGAACYELALDLAPRDRSSRGRRLRALLRLGDGV